MCVCRGREDYEWEHCGGCASLRGGGGEVDFFSHPFFMALLLSDLQPLYIRLTGRFSFIFKHLLGTSLHVSAAVIVGLVKAGMGQG